MQPIRLQRRRTTHGSLESLLRLIERAVMSSADACIPKCKKKAMAGWFEHVGHRKETAMFWYSMWVNGGSVRSGWLHTIMLQTRAQYKRVSRWMVRNQERLVADRMANAMASNQSRDLWNKVRRVKGVQGQSHVIDGAIGREDSCKVFYEIYRDL
jgi:hypothetical protein